MVKTPLKIVLAFIIACFGVLASPLVLHAEADIKPKLVGQLATKGAWLDADNLILPTMQFNAPNDVLVSTDDYKGKWVLLHYWATWCPPCVEELPSLDKLQQKFADTRLKVLAASADTSGPVMIENYFKRHKIKYLPPYTVVPDAEMGLPVSGVPTSFIINPRQEVLLKFEGSVNWAAPEVQQFLADLMGVDVPKK